MLLVPAALGEQRTSSVVDSKRFQANRNGARARQRDARHCVDNRRLRRRRCHFKSSRSAQPTGEDDRRRAHTPARQLMMTDVNLYLYGIVSRL
ncbi:hypothetical protein L596_022704 [Steinernema carpocapsae]|uniref:Uncharacterized protein n=1 Tax=Steinernema carpocapsae TaxID=34508 RepID=A0A4U5MMH5_STECR|nr:hypothetical protein L596_022704 [Steinernema carpocapsae]